MVVALIVLIVAGPSLSDLGIGGIAVVIGIEFVVALLGMLGATSSPKRNTIVLVAGLSAGLIQLVGELGDFDFLLAVGHMAIVIVLLYVHTYIMRDIVPESRVTVSTIFGAIATYMLAILYWASLYSVLATLDAEAFGGAIGPKYGVMDFLYYSAITQTTVGYGDIVPVSQLARSLASMEGLTGQLYIAILVGWLVGRAVSQRPS